MKGENKLKTLHLIHILDQKLIELLKSLTDEEWATQTVAKLWKVKDVAAHLLDGNIRGISASRDRFFGEGAVDFHSYQDLVAYINQLNLSWTKAACRISPKLLTELLEWTGKEYLGHLKTLNPTDNAVFSVAWAGEHVSQNQFHIAREYTEKFLHQQQIRDAVGKHGIMTKELYYPFIDTLMHALPHCFKDVTADRGTVVSIKVTSEIGGQWNITQSENGWKLSEVAGTQSDSVLNIDPQTAWKLFSKSWGPEQVIEKVEIIGDRVLGEQTLKMVGVMA